MMKMPKVERGFTGPSMIPMIDIVFQLMMFFMIAITFENTKAEERLTLPRDMLAKPPEVKPEHELVLNFGYQRDKNGRKISSVPTVYYNQRDIELGQMTPLLEQEKRVLEAMNGREVIEKVTVLIRADADVPTGFVQQLVKKSQDVGFTKFSLRATSDE